MFYNINPLLSGFFFVHLSQIKGYFYGYKEFCCRRF